MNPVNIIQLFLLLFLFFGCELDEAQHQKKVAQANQDYKMQNEDLDLSISVLQSKCVVHIVNKSEDTLYLLPTSHLLKVNNYYGSQISDFVIGCIMQVDIGNDEYNDYEYYIYHNSLLLAHLIPKFLLLAPQQTFEIRIDSDSTVFRPKHLSLDYWKNLPAHPYYAFMLQHIESADLFYESDTIVWDNMVYNRISNESQGYIYPGSKEQYTYLQYHYSWMQNVDSPSDSGFMMPIPYQDIVHILHSFRMNLSIDTSELY